MAEQLRRDERFMTKNFRMSTFVMNPLQRIVYEVTYRYEMLGAKTRKEKTKTRLFPLDLSNTIENSSFAVIQEIPSRHRQQVTWKYKQLKNYGLRLYLTAFFHVKHFTKKIVFSIIVTNEI